MKSTEDKIFKKGSTTYYFSSKFFPRNIRQDVFRLYGFVRTADDYVDAIPAKADDFHKLRRIWDKAQNGEVDIMHSFKGRMVGNMVHVRQMYKIDGEWVESFLDAMQADLENTRYKTLDDSLTYVYGSAEVIGLMMSKVMGLPPKAQAAARMQGRAMQWINFIRDIDEDNALGRSYFPAEDLKKFGLKDLSKQTAKANPKEFKNFINFQLDRYRLWQAEAQKGFKYIPRRLRIPVQTAVDMYNWTAKQIQKDPMIVFEKKIKPRKRHVITKATLNTLIAKH